MIDVDDPSICADLDALLDGKVKVEAVLPSFSGVHYVCSNFYPANLSKDVKRIGNSEDWALDIQGKTVTICRDVNVILYAKREDRL
jgi:hypothetical protein